MLSRRGAGGLCSKEVKQEVKEMKRWIRYVYVCIYSSVSTQYLFNDYNTPDILTPLRPKLTEVI